MLGLGGVHSWITQVKISREVPSHRRHHRVSTPIDITIKDHLYSVSDWSLGGFKIDNWDDASVNDGDELECNFSLPFQGFFLAFNVHIKVIRRFKNTLATKFIDIDERKTELLEHFIEELVRGNMTPVGDTILRIDSPVTPVSYEPDHNPTSDLPVRRWPLKLILVTTLYTFAGIVLLLYILFTLWVNFLSLQVETGVVIAPLEAVVSTADGKIAEVASSLNQPILQGEPLINIHNPKIQQQIEQAKINIDRSKLLLERLRHEKDVAQAKLKDYQGYSLLKLKKMELHVQTLRKQERMAHVHDDRIQLLFAQGHASKRASDQAADEHVQLKREVLSAVNELNEQHLSKNSLAEGRFYSGERFELDVNELTVNIEQVKRHINMDTQELFVLYRHKGNLNLYAPSDGRLVELFKHKGSATKRGETIAVFERDEPRLIEVFLTQEEVLEVKMNQLARVYFTSLDLTVNARVSSIDRSYNSVDSLTNRFTWHDGRERNSKVTLRFVDLNTLASQVKITSGLPAVVTFPNVGVGMIGDIIRSFKIQLKQPETLIEPKNGSTI